MDEYDFDATIMYEYDFASTEARMRELCESLKAETVENREALEREFRTLQREYDMNKVFEQNTRENGNISVTTKTVDKDED